MLHKPDLLFLDEPTSAVDPQSRREFWDSLFELADQGTTLLVSTHYMDEAERCTRLAILDRGRIVADGTPHELMANLPGRTLLVETPEPRRAQHALRDLPGVIALAQIGTSLRVLAANEPELEARVEARLASAGVAADGRADGAESRGRVRRRDAEARGAAAVSLRRLGSIVVKELRQLRRDRLTFAMIIGIPTMQLILFGYAINLDVRNLETAVLDQANTARSRELVAGMAATGVIHVGPQRHEHAGDRSAVARRRDQRRARAAARLRDAHGAARPAARADHRRRLRAGDSGRGAPARGLSRCMTTAAGRRTPAASRS